MTDTSNIDPLSSARRDATNALTAFLAKTAKAISVEQEELRRKFPSMSALPPAVDIDPSVISDFIESDAYRQAVEDYMTGRSKQNLIASVLHLLTAVIPKLIGGP